MDKYRYQHIITQQNKPKSYRLGYIDVLESINIPNS